MLIILYLMYISERGKKFFKKKKHSISHENTAKHHFKHSDNVNKWDQVSYPSADADLISPKAYFTCSTLKKCDLNSI